jgi:glycosyltransferase involved in cell wall biosynthesis
MFSVIIPLYNKEKSISSAIQSVLSQNLNSFELIIINDGSTDTSRERAGYFSDSRIQIIDQENMGVSAARNRGIKAASYPYLAFLDGDDLWKPEYLQTQKELVQDYPEAGLWGCGMGILKNNQKYSVYHGLPEGCRRLIKNYFTMKKRGMLFRPSGTVIHKSIFREVGLFDKNIDFGEDVDMILRVFLKYNPAFYNRNVSYYRIDAENNVRNKKKPIEKCFFYYIDKFKKERLVNRTFRKYYDRTALALMSHHVLYGMSKDEVRTILKEIDFTLQPLKFRLLYTFPVLYRWYVQFLK